VKEIALPFESKRSRHALTPRERREQVVGILATAQRQAGLLRTAVLLA
jgi:hypothetical protein